MNSSKQKVPSIFERSRQQSQEQPEKIPSIFETSRQKQDNIIPPIGLANPELIESFQQNMGNEDKIRQDIKEAERYARETPGESFTRETRSHAARALEGYLGGLSSFFNMITPDLELEDELTGEIEKHKPRKLPEAHELREFTKEKTGKYLEPKSEFSKKSQETISDIGSMFSTPGLSFWQKILAPIGGQIVKQIIKSSGGSEDAQDLGKLGFTMLSTIAGNTNAPKVASRAIAQAEQMLPQGLRFSARPTENALNAIKNQPWYKTGRTSSKGPAMDEIIRIESKIQNGTLDAHEAMQLRRDIQEARKGLNAFTLTPKVDDKKAALAYLSKVDNALLDTFENYGKQVDPKWYKAYKNANEAYRVTQRSKAISDLIGKYAKPLQSDLAKTLFHVAGAASVVKLPALAAASVPVVGGLKLVQATNRLIKSPVLRNHYLKVLAAAETGNAALIKKELDKFDRVSKKLEEHKSD